MVQQTPAKLFLVGDGPERPKAERLCRELGTCDDIRFLGKQTAIEELMAVGDAFILPSEKESFGLAALEAMACELPVIATKTGGLPEVIDHGKNGYLSDVGDIDSMANNLIGLFKDEEMLLNFKRSALEKAKMYDIQHVLPKYEHFYQSIIKANI